MYYHGTNKSDFKELIHDEIGIIWLTKDYSASKKYAQKYYNKGFDPRIFHVNFLGEILDFTDSSNKLVQDFIKDIKSSYLFDIEKNWASIAAFDILERNYFFIEIAKSNGYVGIKVLDSTYGHDHESVAYIGNNLIINKIETISV